MSAKHDAGKTRPSLVILSMSRALQSVSEVATFGAEKYTDDGWREVPDGVKRYTDAMLRHQLAEAGGEVNDPESGLPHAAHIAWNALARLDLTLRDNPRMFNRDLSERVTDFVKRGGLASDRSLDIQTMPDDQIGETFGNPDLTLENIPADLLVRLDGMVWLCSECGWWVEPHEVDDNDVCDECRGQ